jgi:hypothetical protein
MLTTSLKNGISMEITVVVMTKIVRQTIQTKFNLMLPRKGNRISYSWVRNSLFGHLSAAHFSTKANKGWQYTCYYENFS